MSWLLLILFPVALALLSLSRRGGSFVVSYLAPWAAVPALLTAVLGRRGETAEISWLLLGTRFGLDETTGIFLFFTAALWTAASVFARAYVTGSGERFRFHFFFLLTMSGNLGLILARDVAAFYTFFAIMTFAAYGLVVHDRTAPAQRAGRVYLIMAVFGEALLLGAIFLAVSAGDTLLLERMRGVVAEAAMRDWIILLAFMGFGVKAGALFLNFWLPLAHPVAPTPASAVLSGAMIKAGLLGWLHFLPLGEGSFPGWGLFFVAAGLAAAFYGVAAGVTQEDLKTNLAYSSISQMGAMTAGVGIGLARMEAWPAALTAISLFALNHSLGKGALFLGTGVAGRTGRSGRAVWWVLGGLAFVALVIAGLPVTGGGAAKHALKKAAEAADAGSAVVWLLSLTAVGTSILLARFLELSWRKLKEGGESPETGLWAPWAILVLMAAGVVFFMAPFYGLEAGMVPAGIGEAWDGIWPVPAGVGLFLAGRRVWRGSKVRIPAGDLLVWFEAGSRGWQLIWSRWIAPDSAKWQINLVQYVDRFMASESRQTVMNRFERVLSSWEVAGLVFVLLTLLFTLFLVLIY